MKYFFIAGEASGDQHASIVIKELISRSQSVEVVAWGGEKMEAAGAKLKMHYKNLSFMGFWEVFKNLFKILKLISLCKAQIKEYMPDTIVLVDYPGFNLRIAAFANKLGIKVVYYISPKVWVWGKSRVEKIKKYVDEMMVILPFEKEFYRSYNLSVTYVGNPVVDSVNAYKEDGIRTKLIIGSGPLIALLPGSRKQEVKRSMPLFLDLARANPNLNFAISFMSHLKDDYYDFNEPNIYPVFDDAHGILKDADVAIVTSGTATLETALFNVPQIVCYRANKLSYMIGKKLVNISFISLVNLILDRELVKELIQDDFNLFNIQAELTELLNDQNKREHIFAGYNEIRQKLGDNNVASKVVDLLLNDNRE